MDFSLKQALGVVLVLVIAGLCVFAGISLTKSNNNNATQKTQQMWNQVDSTLGGSK